MTTRSINSHYITISFSYNEQIVTHKKFSAWAYLHRNLCVIRHCPTPFFPLKNWRRVRHFSIRPFSSSLNVNLKRRPLADIICPTSSSLAQSSQIRTQYTSQAQSHGGIGYRKSKGFCWFTDRDFKLFYEDLHFCKVLKSFTRKYDLSAELRRCVIGFPLNSIYRAGVYC